MSLYCSHFTPTWVPSSSCLCPSVAGGGGGGRCPHRHRQPADPAHLIKPTRSLVIPASWGKPHTHTNPRGWAAPNLILHCECKVSDFLIPCSLKIPLNQDKTLLHSNSRCQLTESITCFGLRLFTSTFCAKGLGLTYLPVSHDALQRTSKVAGRSSPEWAYTLTLNSPHTLFSLFYCKCWGWDTGLCS